MVIRMPGAVMIIAIGIAPRRIIGRVDIVPAATSAQHVRRLPIAGVVIGIVAARLITVGVRVAIAITVAHEHVAIARIVPVVNDGAIMAAIMAMTGFGRR